MKRNTAVSSGWAQGWEFSQYVCVLLHQNTAKTKHFVQLLVFVRPQSYDRLVEESMAAAADSAKGLVEDDDEQSDTSLTPYIQVLQRWKVWQDNILLWYSTCTQLPCAWPRCVMAARGGALAATAADTTAS